MAPDDNSAPGKQIDLTARKNTLKLYAIWEGALNSFPSSLTTMQGMTNDICAPIKPGVSVPLWDLRDSNSYTVIKQKDGKCRMGVNLKLDLNGKKLTTTNSNVRSDWTSTTGASEKWSNPDCDSATTDLEIAQCSSIVKFYNGSGTSGYKSEYGYYTWGAATAGEASSVTEKRQEATQDICPKGWRLPTNKEYSILSDLDHEKIDNDTSEPHLYDGYDISGIFFPAAGYVLWESLSSLQYRGEYWASTSGNNSNSAFAFHLNESPIGSNTIYRRYQGNSVRCIAQ